MASTSRLSFALVAATALGCAHEEDPVAAAGPTVVAPPEEVTRAALMVRSGLLLGVPAESLTESIDALVAVERGWLFATAEAALGADPPQRLAQCSSPVPLARLRCALGRFPTFREEARPGGVPGTSSRLMEHLRLGLLKDGLPVDTQLRDLDAKVQEAARGGSSPRSVQIEADLRGGVDGLVSLQGQQLAGLQHVLRFLPSTEVVGVVLSEEVSAWMQLPPGTMGPEGAAP